MPDRKYTYQVEIDASQAQQQAAQLRALFAKELGEVLGGTQGTSQSAGQRMAADLQKAAAPLEEIKREMQALAKVDPTAPIDQLQAELKTLDRALEDTRRRYEALTMTAGSTASRTQAQAAEYRAYLTEVERAAGLDARRAIESTGQYLNPGQRYAEFKNDQEGDYLEFANDYHRRNRDAQSKAQQSLDAQIETARLEAEMYDLNLEINQRQQAIARQREAEYQQQIDAMGALTPENIGDPVWELADDVAREIKQLEQEELDLLRSVTEANDQIASLTQQNAAKIEAEAAAAARRAGDFGETAAGAGQRVNTYITVSEKSAANVERMAAGLKESVELSDRLAQSTANIAENRAREEKARADGYAVMQRERALATEKEKQAEAALKTAEATGKARVIEAQTAKSAQAAITAATKAESAERQNISKAESAVIIGEQNRQTIAAKKELAEQTQAFKRENAERTAAMRSSARAGTGGGVGSALSMIGLSPQMLIGGVAASLGLYSIDQIGRNVYEAGRSGAQLERMAVTFEQVARRVGVSSDAMIASIKAASKQTITDSEAMSLGAQILAQKWASSSDDVIGDTGRLVESSRRLAQIYTDESGQFLTTQEVFARLLKYIREGNKELVDQFGVSNARIADALGISKEGLAAAGGAADRFRGLIKVLAEDMDRLGPAMLTSADTFEQAEARIVRSKQRIDRALATPVATLAENLSYGIENIMFGSDFAITRSVAERTAEANPDVAGRKELLETFKQFDELAAKNATTAATYKDALNALTAAVIGGGDATREELAALAEMQRALEIATEGQDAYSRAMAITTEEGAQQNETIYGIVRAMGDYQRMYEDGQLSLIQYTGLMDNLAASLLTVATNAGFVAPALAGVTAELGAISPFLQQQYAARAQWQDFEKYGFRPAGLAGPLPENWATGTPWASTMTGVNAGLSWFGQAAEDWANADPAMIELERERLRRQAEQAAADAAARAWQTAAQKAADAFEQAARESAQSFKGALEAVPGLFSTTSVTEEDLTLAKFGLYEEKPDEYLRQLREEVRDNVDKYAGVDIRDAAARIGLDPNLDPRAILARFEQQWNDSTLFSGGANLDLINADAVLSELGRQEASKSGREAILKYFGLDSPDALVTDPAQRDAFAELIGLTDGAAYDAGQAAQVEFVQGFSTPAADGGGQTPDFLAPIVQSMEGSANTSDISNRLAGLGGSLFGRIFTGFESAATAADWGKPLISSLAASVAPEVFDMLAGALNKPPQ